jgi:hypothetical protein
MDEAGGGSVTPGAKAQKSFARQREPGPVNARRSGPTEKPKTSEQAGV